MFTLLQLVEGAAFEFPLLSDYLQADLIVLLLRAILHVVMRYKEQENQKLFSFRKAKNKLGLWAISVLLALSLCLLPIFSLCIDGTCFLVEDIAARSYLSSLFSWPLPSSCKVPNGSCPAS